MLSNHHRDKVLYKLRKYGMSRDDLARESGVERSELRSWLNRRTDNPTCKWLDKLYRVLDGLERGQRS